MNEETRILETLKALFEKQGLAVLATHLDGQTHGSLVAVAVAKDLRELVFATSRSTRKFNQLSKNPRVALVMDNRNNTATDFQKAVAVTISGIAEEISGATRDAWMVEFLAKHPNLREFALSPTCALVRVRVEKHSLVERFQNVTELRFAPCDL